MTCRDWPNFRHHDRPHDWPEDWHQDWPHDLPHDWSHHQPHDQSLDRPHVRHQYRMDDPMTEPMTDPIMVPMTNQNWDVQSVLHFCNVFLWGLLLVCFFTAVYYFRSLVPLNTWLWHAIRCYFGKSIPLLPSAFCVPTSFRRHSNQLLFSRMALNDTGMKMEVRTKGTKMRKGLTVARFGLLRHCLALVR